MPNSLEHGRQKGGLTWKLLASAAILCLATACTKTDKAADRYANSKANITARNQPLGKPTNPLHLATTHWAREHQKDPKDPKAALNYARNLKAMGATQKAMQVLDQSYRLNPTNTEIASEYGRLALASNNLPLADKLLKRAEQVRGGGDWRVLSARGTVLAQKGHHKQAQSYYLAALRKQPQATSVRNNLALSYAMSGQPQQGEKLLSEVVQAGHETPRMRQNLALVMGLQGKYAEAKQLASVDVADRHANANMNYLRNMVKPVKAGAKAPNQPAIPAPVPAQMAKAPKKLTPTLAAATGATKAPVNRAVHQQAPRAPGAPLVLTGGGTAASAAAQFDSARADASRANGPKAQTMNGKNEAAGGWSTTIEPAKPEPVQRPSR